MEVHPLQSFPSSETGILHSLSVLLLTLFGYVLWFVLGFLFLVKWIFTRFGCLGRGLRPRKADDAAATFTMMEVKKESNRPENDELSAPVSPSINLGLQIGTNSVGSRNERTSIGRRPREESPLTFGQLQELQQQFLIHKHLAAGLRVPTHLLVPIWKSVARTLGSNINGIFNRHHSCKRV